MPEETVISVERVPKGDWRRFRGYCTTEGAPTGVVLGEAIRLFLEEVERRGIGRDEHDSEPEAQSN